MVHDGRDSQVSRRFLLRLCITALSNKTKMSQQNENKTVRGREKERKSHSRYCHWFGLWRDPIDGCRLELQWTTRAEADWQLATFGDRLSEIQLDLILLFSFQFFVLIDFSWRFS